MDVFQLLGDLGHLMSRILLLSKLHSFKSCGDFSAKTQLLYLLVFLSRYLDIFTNFVSYYDTILKIVNTLLAGWTLGLMLLAYKETYQAGLDTAKLKFLLPIIFVTALIFNREFTFLGVFWSFSIYLEVVAILPQMLMIYRMGKGEKFTLIYMMLLALYRVFYIFHWVHLYQEEGYYDNISHVGGSAQVILNIIFFTYYFVFRKKPLSDDLEQDLLNNESDENVVLERNAAHNANNIEASTEGYGTFGEKS